MRNSIRALGLTTTLFFTAHFNATSANALDCIKAQLKNGKVILSKSTTNNTKCPKGAIEAQSGPTGATGPAGADGADGAVRLYGTGEHGDLDLAASAEFDPSKQYKNINIQSGVTLTVKAGTTIRCTGTLTNSGTISVSSINNGGILGGVWVDTSVKTPGIINASAGFARNAPDNGVIGNNTITVLGGGEGSTVDGSQTIGEFAAKAIIFPPRAISGGGGGAPVDGESGGRGGGLLVIACSGAVTNSAAGTITASGGDSNDSGGGGGAGGVVILASQTLVTQAGTITASGGNGLAASDDTGPGGGGGGGIIAFVAPSVSSTGTNTVSGGTGAAAAVAGTVTSAIRKGGAGGGACGGRGGFGGSVNPTTQRQQREMASRGFPLPS